MFCCLLSFGYCCGTKFIKMKKYTITLLLGVGFLFSLHSLEASSHFIDLPEEIRKNILSYGEGRSLLNICKTINSDLFERLAIQHSTGEGKAYLTRRKGGGTFDLEFLALHKEVLVRLNGCHKVILGSCYENVLFEKYLDRVQSIKVIYMAVNYIRCLKNKEVTFYNVLDKLDKIELPNLEKLSLKNIWNASPCIPNKIKELSITSCVDIIDLSDVDKIGTLNIQSASVIFPKKLRCKSLTMASAYIVDSNPDISDVTEINIYFTLFKDIHIKNGHFINKHKKYRTFSDLPKL